MNSGWEQEIAAKNMERILSIAFQLNDVNNFEKSITDNSSHLEAERIEKSGGEIKEKLQTELNAILVDKDACIKKMTTLVAGIGQMPTGKIDRGLLKGFESTIEDIPRQYEHSQIYSGEELSKAASMRDFNLLAGTYVKRCIEEVKLKTTIDNLPDEMIVPLSKVLADQLGF
jgi:hypothetical protein